MEINKDVKEEQLQKMFEYLNGISDMVTIERYCDEKISENEFAVVQEEYKKHILKKDKDRRKNYTDNIDNYRKTLKSNLGIKTEQEATKYFDSLLEQDKEILKCEKNNGKNRKVAQIEEDVINKKYTRVTLVTEGPIRQQYNLKIGNLLKRIESDMNSLFSFPYIINNEQYENLAFYKHNKPIFAICSHEEFACVMLADEGIKELKKLGIPLEK